MGADSYRSEVALSDFQQGAEPRPTLAQGAREFGYAVTNPASLKGLLAALGGILVLMLPDATTALLQWIVLIGVLAMTVTDLVYGLVGKRRFGKGGNRVLIFLRGIANLLFAIVLVFLPFIVDGGGALRLALLVSVAGVFLAVRGVIVVGTASLRKDLEHRGVRVAGGITAVAVGVFAFAAPATTTDALIVTVAVSAIVLGLVMVAWGLRREEGTIATVDPYTATLPEVLWDWVRGSEISDTHREELIAPYYFENPERMAKRAAWWIMLVLSVAIATFAVLVDSTAVVIGAMLVAPLMIPILGLAAALVNGWSSRAVQSTVTVTLGVAVAIALSYGLASWAPVAAALDTNSQVVSRVTPTLIDMLIAVAAGAAGAFATVDKRVSSSIAGVAIAVALVPPLAVVGVSLSADRVADAGGAFLLFLTNFVAIVISAGIVYILTGFASYRALARNPMRIVATSAPFVALAAIILVPLMFTSQGLVSTASQQRDAQEVVEEWLGDDPDLGIQAVTISGDELRVQLLGPGAAPSPESLQEDYRAVTGNSVAVTLVVTPVVVTRAPLPSPTGN
jgi:uncharacterized hydrophobic protein (TIGR00271 family)